MLSSLDSRVQRDKKRASYTGSRIHDLISALKSIQVYSVILIGTIFPIAVQLPLAADEVVGFVVVGIAVHALGLLGHETYHDSFFRGKRTNSLAGKWLFHYPILGRFESLKRAHLEHHRFVGTDQDPDRGHWQVNPRRSKVVEILRLLLAVAFVGRFVNLFRTTTGPRSPIFKRDVLGVLVAQVCVATTFYLFGHATRYFTNWLLPIITIGATIEHFRVRAEHDQGRLLVFSSPSVFEELIFGPINFSLHAIHHLSPATPWFALGSKLMAIQTRAVRFDVETSRIEVLKRRER